MNTQKFADFSEFYPFYLSQHTNTICRRLHFIGMILNLVLLSIIVITGSWPYLPLTLICGYGFSWVGHFFFEKNKPATFTYPLLSLLGDFVMTKDILVRKIKF